MRQEEKKVERKGGKEEGRHKGKERKEREKHWIYVNEKRYNKSYTVHNDCLDKSFVRVHNMMGKMEEIMYMKME